MHTDKNFKLIRSFAWDMLLRAESRKKDKTYFIGEEVKVDFGAARGRYTVLAIEENKTKYKTYKYYILARKGEKRAARWYRQLLTCGFCEADLWNFNTSICDYILRCLTGAEWYFSGWMSPKGKIVPKGSLGAKVLSDSQIHQIIEDIKRGCKAYRDGDVAFNEKDEKAWRKAKYLLIKYFGDLWT